MKKQALFILVTSIMTIYAPFTSASTHIEVALEGSELSTDQVAFIAKLNDKNRIIFINLKNEQRESVITAVKNGLSPDESVQHITDAMGVESHAADFELSN